MTLCVETQGQGPDLVLIHGWGMNSTVWANLLPGLRPGHRLTLIELPGHGASSFEDNLSSLSDWAGACLEVAPPVAAWIGWSLGGQVALRAALDAPTRISRLGLICSSPCFMQRPDWPHAMADVTLYQFAQTLQQDPQQTLNRFLALQVRGDEQARETLRLLRQELAQRPVARSSALKLGLRLLLETDLRPHLHHIACPSLWLLGERDTLVPAAMGEDLEALAIRDASISRLAGCAHAPFLSHPDQSLGILQDFLCRE